MTQNQSTRNDRMLREFWIRMFLFRFTAIAITSPLLLLCLPPAIACRGPKGAIDWYFGLAEWTFESVTVRFRRSEDESIQTRRGSLEDDHDA